MSHFEFIFTLYSLLLGLSLVELLAGLGRTMKARLRVDTDSEGGTRIGWLTPLLGLFVMLDLLSFWTAAWAVRDLLAVSGTTLMAIMLFASAYYLAAHLVFPDSVPEQGDLDPHYFRVRRTVMAILLALLVVQLGYYMSVPQLAPRLLEPVALIMTVILAAMMVAVCFVQSAKWSAILLAALVARYAMIYMI